MALQVNLPTVANPTVRPQPPAGTASPLMHNLPPLIIAARLVVTQQPVSVTTTAPFSFTVNAVDAFGAVVTGYTGTVTITHPSGPGSLGGTTSMACVAGVANFTNLTIGTLGAGNVLHAASGTVTGVDSVSFTVIGPYLSSTFGNMTTLDTGQSWNFYGTGGAFSASSSAAHVTDSATNIAYADALVSDGTLSAFIGNVGQEGLVFRLSGPNDYWTLCHDTGLDAIQTTQIQLCKVVGGTKIVLSQVFGQLAGKLWEVVCNGQRIVVFRDGALVGAWTDSFNATATKFGLISIGASGGVPATWTSFLLTNDLTRNPGGTLATTPLVIFDGDSRTHGYALTLDNDRYFPKVAAFVDGSSFDYDWLCVALSAQTQTQMNGREATWVTARFSGTRPFNIVVGWGGINDLAQGRTASQLEADIVTYGTAIHSAGGKFIPTTIIPNNSGGITTEYNTAPLSTVNAYIRAGGAWMDRVADTVTDAVFAVTAAYNNTTYYNADHVHLVAAGNDVAKVYPAIAVAATIGSGLIGAPLTMRFVDSGAISGAPATMSFIN